MYHVRKTSEVHRDFGGGTGRNLFIWKASIWTRKLNWKTNTHGHKHTKKYINMYTLFLFLLFSMKIC